MEGKRGNVCIT